MAKESSSGSDHHGGGAQPVDAGRRRFLTATTAVVGAASMPASRVAPAEAGAAAHSPANISLPDLPPTLLDPSDDVGPLVW